MDSRSFDRRHARSAGTMVLCAVALTWAAATTPLAHAAPVPHASGNDPGNQFINEAFAARVCFDNTGDATGYQPTYELILPAGVSYTTGTFLGATIDATSAGTCTDPNDCTTANGTALVNPDTGLDVELLDGETLIILHYPLGSNTPAQPPGCMDLTLMLDMPPTVQLGVPLDLQFTPVFSLGATPEDDPTTDAPIFGAPIDLEVTPAVLVETKTIDTPEGETATGPNYTRSVDLEVDIATDETVNSLVVSDTLPDEMQFVAITANGGCSPTATPTTTAPGGTLTLDCGNVTGGAGTDVTITYTFYVPEFDGGSNPILDPSTPGTNTITNDSSAQGTYDEDASAGTPDIIVSDDGAGTDDSIVAKALAIQKGSRIAIDTPPSGTSPSDTIEYTLSVQVSDYFDVQSLVLTDTLGDGQTFDASFTPTFDVVENGPQPQGTFTIGGDFVVAAKNAAGETVLTIDLSAAMVANSMDAALTGDEAADGSIGQGSTTCIITFRSTVDAAYTGPVSGTQPLTVGDAVTNGVSIASSVAGGGSVATDGSSASETIATPAITKSIHAFNGSTSLPSPLLIGAGDTLTYSIRIPIALGSFEQLKLLDYLPIPLFDASEVTTYAGPGVPPAGSWGLGGDDTITAGIAPGLTTSPIALENTLEWDFGTDEGQGANEVIHILFTVTALDNPMADHLNLSNLIQMSLRDSALESLIDAEIIQVTVKAPELEVVKDIVSSTNSNASASSSPPADFDDAWEGADASDVMTFRFTVTNEGSSDAFDVQLTDRFAQGGISGQGFTSCGSLTVEDGAGNTLATTGDLFTGTLILTNPLPADDDGVVETNETAVFTYTCTVDAAFSPGAPIDNTATITNYASATGGPNFATNPANTEGKARTELAGILDVAKTITASSVPGSTPDTNINQGEELTYQIVVTLAEGTYPGFSLTDTQTTIPAVDCSSPPAGMSCSGNVSTVGTTVTVAGTTDRTAGTITYVYTLQQTAGGTNTATAQSSNSGPSEGSATWTRDHPNPAVTKTISPDTADAGDTVTIQLVFQNNDTNNPIFGCTITDVLDGAVYDLSTVTEGTTPAGYAYGYAGGTGTITYTDTSGTVECPGGTATFTAQIRSDVVTSTAYTNTATISGTTLPSGHPNEAAEATRNANGSDDLTIPPPSQPGKLLVSTSEDATDPSDTNIASNPPVAIGEVVDVQITFAFPEGVTNAVTLSDVVDDGLTFVTGSAFLDRNSVALTTGTNPGGINANTPGTPVAVTPTFDGNDIQIALGSVTNTDSDSGSTETLTLLAQFVVANVVGNTAGTDLNDQGRVSFEDAAGTTMNVNSATHTVHVALPVLEVDKRASPTSVTGGSTVTYTLDIRNTATGSDAAPIYDLTVGDTLPADLTSPTVTMTDAGTTGATVNASFAGQVLSGTIDRLDPGEEITITYTAVVDASVPFDEMITNTASANGSSLAGTNGESAASPGTPGSPTGERTGTGSVNDLFDTDPATVTVDSPTLAKTTLNPQARYPIDSLATFEIRVGVPVGSATTFVVTDQLDAGLTYSAGSLSAVLPTGTTSTTGTSPFDDATVGFFSDDGSGLLTFDFGDITVPTAGDIVITYDVVVDNVIGNQNGTSLDNSAQLSRDDPDSAGSLVTGPVVTDHPVVVGEPNLSMNKTITAGGVGAEAGDTVSWQVTVLNGGTTTAYQVDWRDVLPTGLESISNPVLGVSGGNAFLSGTATALTSTHLHITTTTATDDTLDLASVADGDASDFVDIEPGATVTISFDTVLSNTVTPGQAITNSVRADYTSLPTGGRDNSTDPGNVDDDDDGDLNNYEESATSPTMTVAADIMIGKTVSPATYTIGQDVTFQLRVDVIEGSTTSVRVVDVLPAGLTYRSHSIAAGHLAMTFGNAAYDTRLGTGQSVEFDFGDVSNPANASMVDDFFTIDITARVDNVLANQDAVVLRNGEAAQGSNVYVEYGTGPTRVDFDADGGTPGIQGLPISIVEPDLDVAKTVLPTTQTLGDLVTFTITVQHTGTSTSDAFGVVLSDTLPAGLTYEPGSASLPPGDVSVTGQNLEFRIAALTQMAMSTSFTYQARIDVSAVAGSPLTNDVRMAYDGIPGATGAADGGRDGSDGSGGLNDYVDSAAATVTPSATAFIDAQKTVVDLNGPNLFPGESIEYTVTLTNENSAVTGVVFTDTVPAEATYEAATLTTTKGTTDDSTAPDLSVDVGDLAMGETVTITFRARVDAVPGGTLILNQGSVDSNQTVPEPTDKDGVDGNGDQPTDIITSSGAGSAASSIRAEKFVAWKTDADSSLDVTALDIMTYTFVVTNDGGTTLDGVSLTDTIPTGLTFVPSSESATSGAAIVVTAPNLVLSAASLAPGATIVGSLDVEIDSPLRDDDGDATMEIFVNQGIVTSDQTQPEPTDGNTDPSDGDQPTQFPAVATPGTGAPALDAEKRVSLSDDVHGDGTVNPGDGLRYVVAIQNVGTAVAQDVRFEDPRPNDVAIVGGSVTTSQGVVLSEDPVSVNVGPMNPGQIVLIAFDVTIDPSTPHLTNIVNQGQATATGVPPEPTDDNATDPDGKNPNVTPVIASPDLVLTKTASPMQTEKPWLFIFTIHVENRGPSVATNVVVTDPLPDGLDLTQPVVGGPGVSCSATRDEDITCMLGTMLVGETREIYVGAEAQRAGAFLNTATVTMDQIDIDPSNNSDEVPVQALGEGPIPPESVPGLGAAGLALTALLLAALGTIVPRRRRRRTR